jgi:hypothetical protein
MYMCTRFIIWIWYTWGWIGIIESTPPMGLVRLCVWMCGPAPLLGCRSIRVRVQSIYCTLSIINTIVHYSSTWYQRTSLGLGFLAAVSCSNPHSHPAQVRSPQASPPPSPGGSSIAPRGGNPHPGPHLSSLARYLSRDVGLARPLFHLLGRAAAPPRRRTAARPGPPSPAPPRAWARTSQPATSSSQPPPPSCPHPARHRSAPSFPPGAAPL